jgi:hypothetical protein
MISFFLVLSLGSFPLVIHSHCGSLTIASSSSPNPGPDMDMVVGEFVPCCADYFLSHGLFCALEHASLIFMHVIITRGAYLDRTELNRVKILML